MKNNEYFHKGDRVKIIKNPQYRGYGVVFKSLVLRVVRIDGSVALVSNGRDEKWANLCDLEHCMTRGIVDILNDKTM